MNTQGIPGSRGAEHIGFTVPDIEEAHKFLVEVVGCEFIYARGPWQHDDDWFAERINIHPRSVIKELRLYRCKFGPNFEVFEYEAPEQNLTQPRNTDIGGHHVAFYVDQLEPAITHLKNKGIHVFKNDVGTEGQECVYFVSLWGMQFELVSYPSGKAYEANSDVVMWDPRYPER